MPYIAAGLVAALLLLAEQLWRQRLWFTFEAVLWWTARVLVEAGIALVLAFGLRQVPAHLLSFNGILLGLVAGAAAPRAFGRTRLTAFERNFNPVNLAYQRVTAPLDEAIDESSAEAQRLYVEEVIRPAADEGRLEADVIAEAFRQHLSGRRLMSSVERTARLSFITEIIEDDVPDDEKVAALVFKAWEIGAYKALQDKLKPLRRRRYGSLKTARSVAARLRRRTNA